MTKTEKRIHLLSLLVDMASFMEDSNGKAQDCARLVLKFAERINLINSDEANNIKEKLRACYWQVIQPNEYKELMVLKFKEIFRSDMKNWKGWTNAKER